MAVAQRHHINVFWCEARGSELRRKPSAVGAWHEAVGAVAGVEQDQLLAGVDDRRREARLIFAFGQEIVAHQRVHVGLAGVGADERKRSVDENVRVGDRGDLEIPELEAVELRLRSSEERRCGVRVRTRCESQRGRGGKSEARREQLSAIEVEGLLYRL